MNQSTLTAYQHQRLINLYSSRLVAGLKNEELLRRIEYHAKWYIILTGDCPE